VKIYIESGKIVKQSGGGGGGGGGQYM
jgi:hypothetical protein